MDRWHRIQEGVEDRDLAIANDDYVQAGVLGGLAARAGTPSQATCTLERLWLAMRSVNEVRMCGAELTGKFVEGFTSDKLAWPDIGFIGKFNLDYLAAGLGGLWVIETKTGRKAQAHLRRAVNFQGAFLLESRCMTRNRHTLDWFSAWLRRTNQSPQLDWSHLHNLVSGKGKRVPHPLLVSRVPPGKYSG